MINMDSPIPDTTELLWNSNSGFVSSRSFQNKIDSISSKLALSGYSVFVIGSSDAEFVAAAVFAVLAADKTLIIARSTFEDGHKLWQVWGAEAFLSNSMEIINLVSKPRKNIETGIVLTTSGTTGVPKPVKYKFENLIKKIKLQSIRHQSRSWMLTYHPASFAGLQIILLSILSGDTLCYSRSNSTSKLVETFEKGKPTHISGTPTFWRSFTPLVSSFSHQPKQIILGGELADQVTLDLVSQHFPKAILTHIYASTELGSLFVVKDGKVGFPACWLNTNIDGVRLKISRKGTLLVKSNRGMESYLGGRNFNEKWFDSKDSIKIIDDRVIFLGRSDGVINVGGSKVHPEAIEALIMAIDDVIDALVYAVPNPITGSLVGLELVIGKYANKEQVLAEVKSVCSSKLDRLSQPRQYKIIENINVSSAGKKVRKL